MKKKYDFLIVGSGPAGMLSAFLLSKKYKVCLIERGGYSKSELFKSENSFLNLYDKITPVVSQNIFGFGQASCFGGGSVINGALIWDLPDHTKKRWRKELGDDFVEKISANYKKVTQLLGVKNSSILNTDFNFDSQLLFRGCQDLKIKCVTVPRALKKCDHLNNCGFGCNNKNSVDVIFQEEIIRNGGEIVTNRGIKEILWSGGRAHGVVCNENILFNAENIIISAGAINSNALLRNSKITKSSFIQFHLNLKILAIHKNVINSSKGTMFTHQVQEYINDGILFMPTNYNKKSFLTSVLHLSREDRVKVMNDYKKGALYVSQVQPEAVGKIYYILGKPYIKYFLNKSDRVKITKSVFLLVNILKKCGFIKIILPSMSCNKIYDINSLSEIFINEILDWEMLSVHSMAANRIGVDLKTSICDPSGRVHGFTNLFVNDSSSLPSSTGESPQGVIMSNAMRIIDESFS